MKYSFGNHTFSSNALWIAGLAFVLLACSTKPPKPDTHSEKYKQAVSDFYVSLAAIQSDHALFAIEKMKKVAEQYPAEPAVWANLGVYSMRQGNFELATERLNKALNKDGKNARILFLAGILESRKGNIQQAVSHLRAAAKQNSSNPMILFALADELEREDPEKHASRITGLLNRILEEDPDNLAVLLETLRTSAKRGDRDAVKEALEKLEQQSKSWPEEIRKQFRKHKAEILQKEGNITFELAFLRNSLNQLPGFQSDLRKVQLPPNQVGFLISRFLWLPNTNNRAAPLDQGLAFTPADTVSGTARLFKPVGLANDQRGSTVSVEGNIVRINKDLTLPFPSADQSDHLGSETVTALDYNYDFLNDLALASDSGFRLYKQRPDSTFSNVTDSLGLPPKIIEKSYFGSWRNDLDLDGDLDLLLSAKDGSSHFLRNNGDGTFEVQAIFEDSRNIRDLLWADFDSDGDSDAVLLNGDGDVDFYRNERAGEFIMDSSLEIPGHVYALDFGDMNSDGVFEILSWQKNRISSSQYADSTGSWQTSGLIELKSESPDAGSHPKLFIADLDNNAALDLMIGGKNKSRYWLSDENLQLAEGGQELPYKINGLSDLNGDSRLDLAGLEDENKKVILINSGARNYHARIISPRASGPLGDQRINSFGIGGEVESRSGLQYTKQPIDKSWVHLGLGTYEEAEMLRIIWPNGSVQAEFAELGYGSKIMNEQILKGSCPWIMTYNGNQMEFVTDFLWRTALGLKINAQGKANVIHSIDWVKIHGNQLKPRKGYYDVRITADLWETHFFDHVSLMAVDHPEDTEVFVDERFTLPAPEQKLYAMQEIDPIISATDQDGNDVSGKLAKRDKEYVNSFDLTAYQGLAEEHYVEVDIKDKVPEKGKQMLIASGWIYPTDTSINIAISQGNHKPPHGIRVEVPNGEGGWKVAHENIGFPAGKNKTVLVDLENIFEPGTDRRVRLYTNMEIYWNQIRVGVQSKSVPLETEKLKADVSKLRYRGYSELVQKDRFLPTEPDYQQISGTSPKWRDLVGFYTRFGDVKELTAKIDDRYVIMNAGDELVFKFPALDKPREGWTRDFVLIGDGWVKDGDYNTGHSTTVLPLPYHGMEDYSNEPGLLQNDPVYKKHKEDWAKYHTRYITPENFNTALRFKE